MIARLAGRWRRRLVLAPHGVAHLEAARRVKHNKAPHAGDSESRTDVRQLAPIRLGKGKRVRAKERLHTLLSSRTIQVEPLRRVTILAGRLCRRKGQLDRVCQRPVLVNVPPERKERIGGERHRLRCRRTGSGQRRGEPRIELRRSGRRTCAQPTTAAATAIAAAATGRRVVPLFLRSGHARVCQAHDHPLASTWTDGAARVHCAALAHL
eukprot:3084305-Prymnesium_polylepis.2